MKNLLGGKGAGGRNELDGNTSSSGFTITTDTCTEYNQLGRDKSYFSVKQEVEASVS
jgi:pyruvate,orthophosphate dikinase